ncbi:MAG: hypothetical protein K2L70_06675 [Clostridia bacterium]|nr:hypothetical protein [Clostridia bacterium]
MSEEKKNSFQRGLDQLKGKHTKEEFFKIYNMSREEFEEYLEEIDKEGKSNTWFVHLLIAYHKSYPDKETEWDKKWGE